MSEYEIDVNKAKQLVETVMAASSEYANLFKCKEKDDHAIRDYFLDMIGTDGYIDIKEDFNSYFYRSSGNLNSQKAIKPVESPENYYSDKYAAVGKTIGTSYSSYSKANYVKKHYNGKRGKWSTPPQPYKTICKEHSELTKNPEKALYLKELHMFKAAHERLLNKEALRVKLNTPISVDKVESEQFIYPNPYKQGMPKTARIATGTTSRLISTVSIQAIHGRVNIKFNESTVYSFFGTTLKSSEDGVYLGNKEVIDSVLPQIREYMKEYEIAFRTWAYLKKKYSYFLLLNGNF